MPQSVTPATDSYENGARGTIIEISARLTDVKWTARSEFSIWPFRLFAVLFLAAFATLLLEGYGIAALRTFQYSLMFAALTFVTNLLTNSARERPSFGHKRWLQLGICGLAFVVTGLASIRFGSEDDAPMTGLVAIYSSGIWQFLVEVCLVFVVFHFLGLGGRGIGLRLPARSTGNIWVAVLWLATAIGFLGRDVWSGAIGGTEAVRDVAHNVFRNGFSEEFLFRAAIFSRLRLVLPDEWALLAQALLFGLWHYGADVQAARGNVLVAFCFMITVQAVFGYALGFLAMRTRSIAIGSAFHAIADATSII